MIKIAIVDDHPIAVNGLMMMLSDQKNISISAAYPNGNALLEGLHTNVPDVLLMDIMLPDIAGNELALTVLKKYPAVRIVALSSLDAPAMVKSMLHNGCIGYLLKGADKATIISAIEHAVNGQEFLEPSLKEHLLQSMLKPQKSNHQKPYTLTKREDEVLQLIVKGATTQEIGDQLSISMRTAETHRLALIKKLYAKNTAELVAIALRLGLSE